MYTSPKEQRPHSIPDATWSFVLYLPTSRIHKFSCRIPELHDIHPSRQDSSHCRHYDWWHWYQRPKDVIWRWRRHLWNNSRKPWYSMFYLGTCQRHQSNSTSTRTCWCHDIAQEVTSSSTQHHSCWTKTHVWWTTSWYFTYFENPQMAYSM